MRLFHRKVSLELTFIFLLSLGLVAIASAQNDSDKSKKIKVEIQVTEDGETTTTSKEISIDQEAIEMHIDQMMRDIEMVLEETAREFEDSEIDVIIRKNHGHHPNHRDKHHKRYHMHANIQDHRPTMAFLGISGIRADQELLDENGLENGVRITRVVPNSAAESVGLKVNDILYQINGDNVPSFTHLSAIIKQHKPGEEIEIGVIRGGKETLLVTELGEKQMERPHGYDIGWAKGHAQHWQYPPHPPRPYLPDENKYKSRSHGFLGVEIENTEDEDGVIVKHVFDSSAAADMNIQNDDKILEINEEKVTSVEELVQSLFDTKPGDDIKVLLERDGEKLELKGELGPKPRTNVPKDERYEYAYHFEIETLDEAELKAFNETHNTDLDESNALELEHFNLSPNPNNGVFVLDLGLKQDGDVTVKVFDTNGRTVYSNQLKGDSDILLERVDISKEEAGVFLVSVSQNNQGKVARVIKK